MANQEKSKLTHKGDQQAEVIGNGFIAGLKIVGMYFYWTGEGFYKIGKTRLKTLRQKLVTIGYLGVQGTCITNVFVFGHQNFLDDKIALCSIAGGIFTLPLLTHMIGEVKEPIEYNPNDDFILFYQKVGFKQDEINKYPYLLNITESKGKLIYNFLSNNNKLDKFVNNAELIEEVVNLKVDDIRRNEKNRSIIEVVFEEDRKAERLHIYKEMKKEIKDENVIPMDSIFEWNYRDAPHGLITGITKGGKTYELFYLIRQLLARGVDIYIVDPKLADLSTLDKYIGTKCVFEKEDIVNLVEKYAKDMKARYREIRKRPDFKAGKDYYDYGYQPKFLIFDECMSFFGGSTEKNDKKTVKDYLLDVIAEGRQAGYFVILTSQRADTKFIDGAIRDQLGLRMSLGSLSADGYKMTFGSSDYKLRDTKKGAGFIYIDGLGMKKGKEYISPMIPKSYDFFEDFENLIQLEEDDSKVKAENKKVIQANFNQKNNDEEVTFEQLQKQKLEENENKKADEK